jgi:hypothetical protein
MPGSIKRKKNTTSTPDPSKKPKTADDVRPDRLVFDRDGDILVNVRSFEHDGLARTEFLVSSKALSLGSSVFNAMFNGRFVEGAEPAIGYRRVFLHDDDPKALMMLFNVAHLRFGLLPRQITLDELFNIAVVADKYDMISAVKHFIKHHCNFHRKDMTKAGNEVYLFVSWALGQVRDFKKMFMHLALDIKLLAPSLRTSAGTLSDKNVADTLQDICNASAEDVFNMPAEQRETHLNKLAIANCEDEDFSSDLPPHAKGKCTALFLQVCANGPQPPYS